MKWSKKSMSIVSNAQARGGACGWGTVFRGLRIDMACWDGVAAHAIFGGVDERDEEGGVCPLRPLSLVPLLPKPSPSQLKLAGRALLRLLVALDAPVRFCHRLLPRCQFARISSAASPSSAPSKTQTPAMQTHSTPQMLSSTHRNTRLGPPSPTQEEARSVRKATDAVSQ
jgi:hypothetical protein